MMSTIDQGNQLSQLHEISPIEYESGNSGISTTEEGSSQRNIVVSKQNTTSMTSALLFGKFGASNNEMRNDFNKGRLYEEMGIASAKCGNISEALCLYDLALHEREAYTDDDDATLIPTLLNKARAFREIDLIRSCSQYKEIVEMITKKRVKHTYDASKNDDLFLAQVLIELAHVQCQRGDFFEGNKNFRTALKIRKQNLGDHEEVAFVWYLIGRANHIERNYSEALEAYTNSLKILQKIDCSKGKNNILIQSIQRLLSDRTMLANVSTKHWSSNTV